LPSFHDEPHLFNCPNVLQWVALQHDQVSQLTFLKCRYPVVHAAALSGPLRRGQEGFRWRRAPLHKLCYLEGHQAVHAVGPDGVTHARSNDRPVAFGSRSPGVPQLGHDGSVVSVALLNARWM
jgi:hypothetical protein